MAARRGITLEPEVVAKLMVLELLLREDFEKVLGWLARNELRERMVALENTAGRVTPEETETAAAAETEATPDVAADEDPEFPDALIRWAKLPPTLSGVDLNPYLHLAAAFSGALLLDTGLPQRLRDLAANLLSSVRAEQKSVTDDDLRALSTPDAATLAQHLGRAARDRPTEQLAAIVGLLRITRRHPSSIPEAATVLAAIPADDVKPAVVLSFEPTDVTAFRGVLDGWLASVSVGPTRTALNSALSPGSG